MEKVKVLYISHEIFPFLPESSMSTICRELPQLVQESGKEIRTFMPRFGCINERRNQLHEVIRLSGMNLIINDSDHPLIIKVASIQSARMQVYFIENEDYFQRKFTFRDKNNKFFEDNDERSVFFNRGVIETVKKLGWAPNIIHVHGWMSALSAFYIKTIFKENPLFYDSKVIFSLYNDSFEENFSPDFYNKIKTPDMEDEELADIKNNPDYITLMKSCLKFADGVVFVEDNIHPELVRYTKELNIPFIHHTDENFCEKYQSFYETVNSSEEVYS
jgi:starch synthase